MGRSLRSAKKHRPKLTVRRRRQPFRKGKTPVEITERRPDAQGKLGTRPSWSQQKGSTENYEEAGLLSDPNLAFGRNAKSDALEDAVREAEAREATGEDAEIDEDFGAMMGKERASGPAPPPRLTSHQRNIMQRLITAHGENIAAMTKDTKLNAMLLPPSRLKKMLASYKLHGGGDGKVPVQFRAPNKRLW